VSELSGKRQLAQEVAGLVADAADEPVLVLGSLPPDGRDLDLLARSSARERIAVALAKQGLIRSGSTLVKFGACSAYAVELIEAEDYLPAVALEDLFGSAQAISGFAPLAQPSPAHALLILAGLIEGEAAMSEKRRRRLQRILAADPGAWGRAAELAPSWGAEGALTRLRAVAEGRALPAGRPLPRVRAHPVFRRTRARMRGQRPLLVSLSGIDGSGKSSQARWLVRTLAELDVEAELVWNDLLGNFALDLVGRPAKAVLRLLGRQAGRMAEYEDTDAGDPSATQEATNSRAREAWSTFVTLSNALEQRVMAARSFAANRVVVFDRGPLDLAVRMEVLYRAGVARQRTIVKVAAPRPDLAFFLDIPPELSLTRKDDVWSPGQLEEHARIYRSLATRFGVIRLDGRRPADELAAEIASAAWQRLSATCGSSSPGRPGLP
jgi:thymidylate kinase